MKLVPLPLGSGMQVFHGTGDGITHAMFGSIALRNITDPSGANRLEMLASIGRSKINDARPHHIFMPIEHFFGEHALVRRVESEHHEFGLEVLFPEGTIVDIGYYNRTQPEIVKRFYAGSKMMVVFSSV